MISYREKQMLMVMKMLQDETIETSNVLQESLKAIEAKTPIPTDLIFPSNSIEDYDKLVQIAEDKGYDTYVRATDLLSKEELADIERRKEEIDAKFKKITHLKGLDFAFLFAAIALQIARQTLQPRLDFETLLKHPQDRECADSTAKNTDATKTKEKIKSEKEKIKKETQVFDEKGRAKNPHENAEDLWHASIKQIADIHKVPYDANGEGIDGNHRYKTLGHDPWLGYLFGTCNILTNTLTTNKMVTYHVQRGHTVTPGDIGNTGPMFHHSIERFKEVGGKPAIAIALVKQAYHIKTDVKSKKGIPLPFVELFLDEKTIAKLCSKGIDYNAMKFVGDVAKQAAFSELINFIIATSHRIMIAKEEYDSYCKVNNISNQQTLLEILKQKGAHDIFFGNETLNEVRTRKILLISNAVASAANIIYVGIAASLSVSSGDAKGTYDALSKLDVGGILITLKHLLTDTKVITKIKKDFITQCINDDFEKKLAEIEAVQE